MFRQIQVKFPPADFSSKDILDSIEIISLETLAGRGECKIKLNHFFMNTISCVICSLKQHCFRNHEASNRLKHPQRRKRVVNDGLFILFKAIGNISARKWRFQVARSAATPRSIVPNAPMIAMADCSSRAYDHYGRHLTSFIPIGSTPPQIQGIRFNHLQSVT